MDPGKPNKYDLWQDMTIARSHVLADLFSKEQADVKAKLEVAQVHSRLKWEGRFILA